MHAYSIWVIRPWVRKHTWSNPQQTPPSRPSPTACCATPKSSTDFRGRRKKLASRPSPTAGCATNTHIPIFASGMLRDPEGEGRLVKLEDLEYY